MIQSAYLIVILVGSIITTNVAKEIFQSANNSDVSQISGSSTPWVIPDLIPTIEKLKTNVFQDLKFSPLVQKIWDMETECNETRAIFFKLHNQFLYNLGHPVPAALANIVSKSASLFEPLNMTVYFEAVAINLAEFLLSKDKKINRFTSARYVYSISKELVAADLNDKESVWKAALDGYGNFVVTYGFALIDVIDELLELFASELIVLHDK